MRQVDELLVSSRIAQLLRMRGFPIAAREGHMDRLDRRLVAICPPPFAALKNSAEE